MALSLLCVEVFCRDFDIWAGKAIKSSKLLQIVQFNSIQFNSMNILLSIVQFNSKLQIELN